MVNDGRLIAIDVDGTLCEGQIDEGGVTPFPEAIWAVKELLDRGWAVVFYTSRSWHRYEETVDWLEEQGIWSPHVICGKVGARYYIGDEVLSPLPGWDMILDLLGDPE